MAYKGDKGREDSDDLGLKDRCSFPLTLKLSNLDLANTHVQDANVQFQLEICEQKKMRSKNEYTKESQGQQESKPARPEALHIKYRLISFKAFKSWCLFILNPKQRCV